MQWKSSNSKRPLVIKGCRQCGKTYSVMHFAKASYKHVVYVNFMDNPDYATAFAGALDCETITLNLSAQIPGSQFAEGDTCLILDEIQECPRARTALKSFKIDGRYDVFLPVRS